MPHYCRLSVANRPFACRKGEQAFAVEHDPTKGKRPMIVCCKPETPGAIEAPDWLSAKAALGFVLTDRQEDILAARQEGA